MTVSAADRAVILGGARTPIGPYGGGLSRIRTDDLPGLALMGACGRAGITPADVQEIAAGAVNASHEGMGDVARWAALAAGFPTTFRRTPSTASARRR